MGFSVYGDLLAKYNQKIYCGSQPFGPADLHAFAKQQMDYILGSNPQERSYMVGFGTNPPLQAHHRGASVPTLSPNEGVDCPASFENWFHKDVPNAHELTGAIVGGPDRYDNFADKRWESSMTEPCTYINALQLESSQSLIPSINVLKLYYSFNFMPSYSWRSIDGRFTKYVPN